MSKLKIYEEGDDIRIGIEGSEGYQANVVLKSDMLESDIPMESVKKIANTMVDLYNIRNKEKQKMKIENFKTFTESKGQKHDDDKLDFTLLPWDSVEEVVKVLEMGAKKYSRDNWKEVDDGKHRYLKALNRHLVAANKGEEVDPESGLSHYAHIACNALFLLHFNSKLENIL